MASETIHTLVVGGGQAGLAMSAHLRKQGIQHVVLERNRIAERWRSERWDSLVANGPAWHDRFPEKAFSKTDKEGFASKEDIIEYFEEFASQIDAPVRCGVSVKKVEHSSRDGRYHVETSAGDLNVDNVVAATGPFQKPVIPPIVPRDAPVEQIHSSDYRNPEQLKAGAVLVVGSGSSGAQIADELLCSGRQVYLSMGPHDRPPRSYRGRDFCWWLGVMGKWDAEADDPDTGHVTISVSGAHGGRTVDFRKLAERGMVLTGMTRDYHDGSLTFADDLKENLNGGDMNYLSFLREADEYAARHDLDLPEEPEAYEIAEEPDCVISPIESLDLKKAGISTIVWATGYAFDFSWLDVNALDENGQPRHEKGVTPVPGIYFLGLPFLTRRGSSFIWGVWRDAEDLAKHIARQRAAEVA